MPEIVTTPMPELKSITDKEKYLLKSREDVVMSLFDLTKKPDLITAYFNHGNESIITTVINVLPDRDLVILECGPNNKKNSQMLTSGSTTCLSKHNDIDIRFQLNELRNARYRGQQVFAAPIPDSLLRLQRREFFRVQTPLMSPITCHLTYDDKELVLPLADISIGGLALVDAVKCFHGEKGLLLEQCTINFPDKDEQMEVDLEIRGIFMYGKNDGHKVNRIGCAFIDLSPDKSSFIQRYINRLQIQQQSLSRR